MNKWFIVLLILMLAPLLFAWAVVRHPIRTVKELYKSWRLVFNGESE
jgi:hypothetical protein